jgi:heavy metal sensor kinase
MNWRSVRVRLAAWYAAVLVATFAVAGGAAWLAMRDSIHESVDEDLGERLALLTKESVHGWPSSLGARYRVSDGSRWVYQSPGSENWGADPIVPSTVRTGGTAQTMVVNGHRVRVLTARAILAGVASAVQIGVPVGDFYKMLNRMAWTVVIASPLVLLIASAGGYWMSTRALEPVDRITRAARAIGADSLTARLPLRDAGDELDRLSETLNEMLARIDTAFRRVTQFTADASHELRTPTAIIRTTAELARRRSRTEAEYVEALDRILAESERTTRLIDDLLLLARSDAEGGAFFLEPMDFGRSLHDACEQARVLTDAAGLSFVHEMTPACPMLGDAQALRRLFLILFDNAVKYTAAGGTVHASMHICATNAIVEVRDTGVGIHPDELPHLFERFYRVGHDRSRDRGGVGLGLAIAQRIATAHHGDITVRSEPGGGSVFRVRIPIVAPAAI